MDDRATAKWHDCSSPKTRRCCGGTLPPGGSTTCWSALAARHHRSPPDPAVDPTRAVARDIISSRLEHSDADGKAELGLVRQRCCDKKRAGQKREEWAPGATWTRLGTQNFTAGRLEPGRKPNKTSRRASSLPRVGAPGQLLSSDLRTTRPPYEPHTTQSTETTLPPAGDQQFCGPQSRQAGIVALRRALWRLPTTCRALGAGRASRCALRRSGQTCASSLDGRERWQRQGQGRARSRLLAVARPRPGIQIGSMSKREPTRAIQ